MTYITGTITDANPAAALYTALAPALTAAGYTLVDTVVISTRTHKVWKSAAANNTYALDWYLDIAYTTTGAGNLFVCPYEFYDPATDLAQRGPQYVSSTTIEQTFFSQFGATAHTLEQASANVFAGANTLMALTCSTASFGYWISVTGNRVLLLGSNTPGVVVYAGFYTPVAAFAATGGAALFPLVLASVQEPGTATPAGTVTTTRAGVTRLPRLPTGAINWALQSAGIMPAYGQNSAYSSLTRIPDGSISMLGGRYVSPLLLSVISTTGVSGGTYGVLDGLTGGWSAATVTRGDTITIDGNPWIAGSSNAGSPPTGLFMRAV